MKKTISVSTRGTYLSLRNSRLAIHRDDELLGHIPFEDIGLLVLETTGISLSSGVLKAVADAGGSVLACDDAHNPTGIFLPVTGNSLLSERLRFQVQASKPLNKNIWAAITRAKLVNQSMVLVVNEDRSYLGALAASVRSGDPRNCEARGAQYYWPRIFAESEIIPEVKFRRRRDGLPPNGLLNYGYMILRAATARAICAAGLQPGFGIHHVNRYNGFCLADDLMEPYRPFVDQIVRDLVFAGELEVNQLTKPLLLGILAEQVKLGGECTPLDRALEITASSLVACYEAQVKNGCAAPQAGRLIKLPEFQAMKPCQ